LLISIYEPGALYLYPAWANQFYGIIFSGFFRKINLLRKVEMQIQDLTVNLLSS